MNSNYRTLPFQTINQSAIINRRAHQRLEVSMDDPATSVMTDLSQVTAFSIEPTAGIQSANDKMIACGVRLLFVADEAGALLGLITATDLLGEKPVQYVTEHGGSRDDIIVQDIMTPKSQLEVIYLRDLNNACVGDVVETMRMVNRQHMLVVNHDSEGREKVCGIYSTTQINRQLGTNIEPSLRVGTFADIGRVLATA